MVGRDQAGRQVAPRSVGGPNESPRESLMSWHPRWPGDGGRRRAAPWRSRSDARQTYVLAHVGTPCTTPRRCPPPKACAHRRRSHTHRLRAPVWGKTPIATWASRSVADSEAPKQPVHTGDYRPPLLRFVLAVAGHPYPLRRGVVQLASKAEAPHESVLVAGRLRRGEVTHESVPLSRIRPPPAQLARPRCAQRRRR
jgi:hypothetical protein